MNAGVRRVGYLILALFVALAAQLTYLQVARSTSLADAPGNARRFLRDISRDRGPIVSSDGVILAKSVPADDEYKYQRVYPPDTAQLFAHIVGFQSILFGSVGVENAYSASLAGRTFKLQIGNLSDAFATRQPVGTVVLTASKVAQQAAATALNGRRGSVVVLDVQTGAVVAAYSNPTFDPNLLVDHQVKQAQGARSLMLLDPTNPLLARAWRELYPPGSTFKTVTASITLQDKVDVDKVFPTVRSIPLPQTTARLHNFGDEACGGTLEDGFIQSCNTTYGQVGLDLGNKLAAGLPNFGVQTAPPHEDGSGFDPAIVPSTGPKQGSFPLNKPTFAQAAIGQNAVAVTPMEMALVAESVATGGIIRQPRVVDCVLDPQDKVVQQVPTQEYRRAMDPATAATMKTFMLGVVNDPRGTGTAAQIPGVQVAGKTGTAETAPGQNPHAWFIAFAPANAPRYAIAVLVEHGGVDGVNAETTGGRVAAPIAQQVLQTLLATPAPPSRCTGQPESPQSGNATSGG